MGDEMRNPFCRASAGVSWVVQDRGVLVIDELARRSVLLTAPESAAWELLLRGHTVRRVGTMLRWVMGVSEKEARARMEQCLHAWTAAGWITASDANKGN